MSKKKGLSLEEKRERLLSIFYEKKDVFLLKELEKIGPKEKGIVMQSVKDVLNSLLGDDLVESDKIGSSVYYWSFPSQTFNTRSQKLAELKDKSEELRKKSKSLDTELKKLEVNEKEVEVREKAIKQLEVLVNERDELKAKLEKYKDCDPQVLNQMERECQISKEAVNRWTDNVFQVKTWAKRKFSLDDSVVNKQFGIPEDFDYPE